MRIYCFDFPTGHEGRSGRRWRRLATNTAFGFESMEIEAVWPGITKILVICGTVRSMVHSKSWRKELMGFRLRPSAGPGQDWVILRGFLSLLQTSTLRWRKPFWQNPKGRASKKKKKGVLRVTATESGGGGGGAVWGGW